MKQTSIARSRSAAAPPIRKASTNDSVDALIEESSVVIVAGSGGVGKTTMAAALGVHAATTTDRRVLVLTIDPAKRLASALGLERFGNETRTVEFTTKEGSRRSFSAAMLDTSHSWDALIRRHAPDEQTRDRILANPLYRNITQRFVQSHDYIAMERLYELRESAVFDLIVIDTPPSRHALDFLDAPDRMAEFFSSSLLKWITLPYRTFGPKAGRLGYLAAKPFYQVADRILGSQFLEDIAEFFLLFQSMYAGFVERANEVTALLHDAGTSFVVVSSLEPAPLKEAEFLLGELERRDLHVAAFVCNRVLPEVFSDPGARALAERMTTSPDPLVVGVGEVFLRFAALAEEETSNRRRLGERQTRMLTATLREEGICDVDGLARLAAELQPTARRERVSGRAIHSDGVRGARAKGRDDRR